MVQLRLFGLLTSINTVQVFDSVSHCEPTTVCLRLACRSYGSIRSEVTSVLGSRCCCQGDKRTLKWLSEHRTMLQPNLQVQVLLSLPIVKIHPFPTTFAYSGSEGQWGLSPHWVGDKHSQAGMTFWLRLGNILSRLIYSIAAFISTHVNKNHRGL